MRRPAWTALVGALITLALLRGAEGAAQLPSFEKLASCFPQGDGPVVKQQLGGGLTAAWLGDNTCAIRASAMLQCAGVQMRAISGNTVKDKQGRAIHFRVRVLEEELRRMFGPPKLVVTKKENEGEREAIERFRGKPGVIIFEIKFGDATGHVDLWDGAFMVGWFHRGYEQNFEYFNRAFKISLWETRYERKPPPIPADLIGTDPRSDSGGSSAREPAPNSAASASSSDSDESEGKEAQGAEEAEEPSPSEGLLMAFRSLLGL